MGEKENVEGMLSPYRVLDLTNEKGLLCGKVLGDMGADVIKVERPGGDPSRNIGPFYHDDVDPEKSLFWFAYCMNKRGITLNIETADGREIFKRLVKTADFVIESFDPWYLDRLGLGYSALSEINPRIILTSITPFGQTGPYAHYKASDMVLWAMGGRMYITGDLDRPPVQVSPPQAYCHASMAALGGSLMAHYHRELTGEGQHVDVSIQQAVVWAQLWVPLSWDVNRENTIRTASLGERIVNWPCKGGYVTFIAATGVLGLGMNALVRWIDSEGMATDELKDIDWDNLPTQALTAEEINRIVNEPIGKFFMAHTKEELLDGAIRLRFLCYPCNTTEDILKSPQLAARDFFVHVEHPELGDTITYPGAFAKFSETPLKLERRAPLIGEHNEEIYLKELGLSKEELVSLKQVGAI